MEGLERIVKEHPFFAGIEEEIRELVCGCAKNVRFEAGQYLFHEGEPADQFYLIRHGRVALELTAPGRGAVTFQTLGEGEIVGRLVADSALSLELRRKGARTDARHRRGRQVPAAANARPTTISATR